MTSRPSPALAGGLALVIAVVLGAGVIGALTTDEDKGDDTANEQAEREGPDQGQQQAQPAPDAQAAADADRRAFDIILENFEVCRARHLPDARARHNQAVAQLREQEAALRRVIEALPPGKAKESLTAQVAPDFDSAIRVVDAELRGVETRCKLALTVYQLTHDSLPRPVPAG